MLRTRRFLVASALLGGCAAAALATSVAAGAQQGRSSSSGCQLNSAKGQIKHVIYVQFDNTHLTRDRANVPSDLEQMPHLLSFMQQNGTVFSNDHTILISHTAGGILSALTGLYPDRQGQTVSNSYGYFNPASST